MRQKVTKGLEEINGKTSHPCCIMDSEKHSTSTLYTTKTQNMLN
jgi:hypothetical protein